jgi:hypothetical protein
MKIRYVKWGWECNARWSGTGNSFNLTIPTNHRDVVIQGVKYNPTFKEIEVWGYITPNNNVGTKYKNDLPHPECSPSDGGHPCDRGTDGTPQSRQSKELS